MGSFKGKSFLKLLDLTPEEFEYLLSLSAELKALKKSGKVFRPLEGKNIVIIFEKDSTRTRCAFEVAAADLGMSCAYLGPTGSQIGKKESIADTARVLGRLFEGIEYRGFDQSAVEKLAELSGVPVWNGLTDWSHPTQVLADLLTVKEHFGSLKGRKLVFSGDSGFNVGHSLMVGCALAGMHYVACSPEKYLPRAELVAKARAIAEQTGGSVTLETDPMKAVKDADVIYTDVWVSMGEPERVWYERILDLKPYRVTGELMAAASPDVKFMHCLPAFHDLNTDIGREMYEKYGIDCMEVTDEVFESPASIVFDEAENRMHTIKAVMAATLGAEMP